MAQLPDSVPNDWDINSQVTKLTETVNQLIDYISANEKRWSEGKTKNA